ncbi:MAG: hypothetical protein ACTSWN_15145 [Promethearchaeota archaeon]
MNPEKRKKMTPMVELNKKSISLFISIGVLLIIFYLIERLLSSIGLIENLPFLNTLTIVLFWIGVGIIITLVIIIIATFQVA